MWTKFIKLYQRFISPFLGNRCRFYPSCSQYAIDALEIKGFWKAIPLIVWRVLRCNPFFEGGVETVPNLQQSVGGNPERQRVGQRAK